MPAAADRSQSAPSRDGPPGRSAGSRRSCSRSRPRWSAVLGAIRLNNGAGGQRRAGRPRARRRGAAGAAGRRRRADAAVATCGRLALVATALLLATSLRGWQITGHDIQAEYYAFSLTDGASTGRRSCCRTPTTPASASRSCRPCWPRPPGLSGVMVFKLVLQLVFALVPAAHLPAVAPLPDRRLALVAAIFTMAFPTFFTDMPYLVRQEIAFFFLALMLLAATEPEARLRGCGGWSALFGVGVVLSHYSTTYLLVLAPGARAARLPGAAALGPQATRRERRRRPTSAGAAQPGDRGRSSPWPACSGSGRSPTPADHAVDVAREHRSTRCRARARTAPAPPTSPTRLFSRRRPGPRERLNLFVEDTLDLREPVPARSAARQRAGPDELKPEIVAAATVPLTPARARSWSRSASTRRRSPTSPSSACAALMQLFLLVGVFRLLVRRDARSAPQARAPRLTADLRGRSA